MAAFKNKENGTWYVQFRYTDWRGERQQKLKRGFSTKKAALAWEREFIGDHNAEVFEDQKNKYIDPNSRFYKQLYRYNILPAQIKGFQPRKPNLHVFSAHLHMDEATPHLHIDFIPFTTGSKRGLETRVSLKQALAAQGFTGGTRTETEWNQWIQSEKEELALVMERHGVEWEQKGTHEKHLSVLEYEKKMRAAEVAELDNLIEQKQSTAKSLDQQIGNLSKGEEFIIATIERFDNDPEWQLPEPSGLMTAKAYMQKLVIPFVTKLKNFARKALTLYYQAVSDIAEKNRTIRSLRGNYWNAKDYADRANEENQQLRADLKDYGILRKFLGSAKTDELIQQAKDAEVAKRQRRNLERER